MAQADFFLKIEGLEGESQDDKHKNEIHLSAFHIGAANHGTGHHNTGSGAGKVLIHDMHCSKLADKSSPGLFLACCNGKHYSKATLVVRKAGEKAHEYLEYAMTNVFLSSYSAKGSPHGDLVNETFSLNFSKIEYTYVPQNKDGSAGGKIKKIWNVATNSDS